MNCLGNIFKEEGCDVQVNEKNPGEAQVDGHLPVDMVPPTWGTLFYCRINGNILEPWQV